MATRQPAAPVALREPPAVPVQPVASPPLPAAARVGARSVRSFGWRAGTLGASHLCHVAIRGLQLIRLILPLALCDARKAAAPNNPVSDWCSVSAAVCGGWRRHAPLARLEARTAPFDGSQGFIFARPKKPRRTPRTSSAL